MHRRKSGALHGFYCAGVRCHVAIAHFAGFRDGGATDTGDLHGRNHSKKPDPLTSGDHMGQISFSNSGSNRHCERALQARSCDFARRQRYLSLKQQRNSMRFAAPFH